MIRVGIVGASGYMGGEALRVLLEHPEVENLNLMAGLERGAGLGRRGAHPR